MKKEEENIVKLLVEHFKALEMEAIKNRQLSESSNNLLEKYRYIGEEKGFRTAGYLVNKYLESLVDKSLD